jgi:fatty-acyl-CoA synthase
VAVITIGWFRDGVDKSVALAPNVKQVLEPNDLDVEGTLPSVAPAAPDDLAFLQYTSGSTGHPRGVMLTHRNLVETCRFMAEAAGLTPEDRVVSWLPLYHDMGLIGLSFTPPLMATPVWLLPPDLRNPRQWLELITEVRATFTVSPDFGYRNCVRNVRETSDLDLTSLKAALSGAEPVRLSTIQGFETHFGIKDVIAPCYGLAEATLAVTVHPRATPIRVDASGRFVSSGVPCRGVSVRIVPRAEEGPTVELPADVEGEIQVKSPGVMKGYYNDPEGTALVLSPDGWLRTGDLGFVDREGLLYVTGRIKDVMILGGENVIPVDVEEVVDAVPGVRYSAAVGVASERTGTQRMHVARNHRPARVLLVRAGTIPKTSSGKIQRARLGHMIDDGALRERLVYEP